MTPSDLETIGRLLYGLQWQGQLARNIGVTDRTVRNWLDGKHKTKRLNEEKIKQLMNRHANFIRILLSNMESREVEKVPMIRK